MAKHIAVFNPTDRPVLITESGRTVGGGEWASVNAEDSAARRGLANGDLIEVTRPDSGDDLHPDAVAAFDAADAAEIGVPSAAAPDVEEGDLVPAAGAPANVAAAPEEPAEDAAPPAKPTRRKES